MKHLIGKKLFNLVLCAFTKSSKEKDTFRENLLIPVHLRNKRAFFKNGFAGCGSGFDGRGGFGGFGGFRF